MYTYVMIVKYGTEHKKGVLMGTCGPFLNESEGLKAFWRGWDMKEVEIHKMNENKGKIMQSN